MKNYIICVFDSTSWVYPAYHYDFLKFYQLLVIRISSSQIIIVPPTFVKFRNISLTSLETHTLVWGSLCPWQKDFCRSYLLLHNKLLYNLTASESKTISYINESKKWNFFTLLSLAQGPLWFCIKILTL